MSVWNAFTIEERIRQFFYVKSSLKDRRFEHLFFTTRIRNTRFLIAVLVLCFVSPCLPTLPRISFSSVSYDVREVRVALQTPVGGSHTMVFRIPPGSGSTPKAS